MAKPRTRLAIAPQVFAIFSQPTKREENLYEGIERSGHLRYLRPNLESCGFNKKPRTRPRYLRFGLEADVPSADRDVRFTPEADILFCHAAPLRAKREQEILVAGV